MKAGREPHCWRTLPEVALLTLLQVSKKPPGKGRLPDPQRLLSSCFRRSGHLERLVVASAIN